LPAVLAVLAFLLVGIAAGAFVGGGSGAHIEGDLLYGPADWGAGIVAGVAAGAVAFLLVFVVTDLLIDSG
jgi:hypothetical protein